MARFPFTEPQYSDDSWGLLLIHTIFCVVLLIAALVWL